ncbi:MULTISPECIES: M28 family peptidase [unclassified Breznakia]|uniref:M28 family peptidase n=1 Tax=unclassified Breznakia TaxID=2623764 RepID=UPI002476BEE3|nr:MULTISPECIES: M28 family peptidase [unclassified Breznakia]MDH6367002.1 aminopeptidase YwaD [Breznakia sp. PH1-1]MDH6404226.1 aminopeptidase YwaD [Breznakia sp. PF1-11]MDH6411889.1 aminopeptidase YwaD [Breznakia sp. PFB1-11]MDH6414214.1 aminopeptidase YwaD [Breznakia sp. PFB1-14]MDH6415962.1 aminopeptidase YwaD [Breznakia sp. PFB1-4]
MTQLTKHIEAIIKERACGSEANNEVVHYIKQQMEKNSDFVESFPFECMIWKKEYSYVNLDGKKLEILASPFSKEVHTTGKLCSVSTIEELRNCDMKDCIVLVYGDLAKNPISAKDYPFYYPDEHKEINDIFESRKPKAILAFTGQASNCGLHPFPLFEDGNFEIPSAYIEESKVSLFLSHLNESVEIAINSQRLPATSSQLVATKKGNKEDLIIVCAHMDSKDDTDGAIDNGSGTLVLLRMLELLDGILTSHTIQFVPYNSEEVYHAGGELAHLGQLKDKKVAYVLNIDTPCFKKRKSEISLFNIDSQSKMITDVVSKEKQLCIGEPWYAGDHMPFAMQGIPTLAVIVEDFNNEGVFYTHTKQDNKELLDDKIIEEVSASLVNLLLAIDSL